MCILSQKCVYPKRSTLLIDAGSKTSPPANINGGDADANQHEESDAEEWKTEDDEEKGTLMEQDNAKRSDVESSVED